jgi:hypothetical protein
MTITATVCVPQSSSDREASRGVAVAVILIAPFDGEVGQLRRAYWVPGLLQESYARETSARLLGAGAAKRSTAD